MKNVTQITAIARIKGKKNTAKMLRELYNTKTDIEQEEDIEMQMNDRATRQQQHNYNSWPFLPTRQENIFTHSLN